MFDDLIDLMSNLCKAISLIYFQTQSFLAGGHFTENLGSK